MTDKIKKVLLGVAALAALALGGSALAGAASGGKDTAAQQSEAAEGPEHNEAGGEENGATDRDNVQDGNGKDDATEQESDKVVTGAEASRAKAAAAAKTGGSPGSVERDSENGATYEVEVTKPDGQKADVRLDEQFKVVTVESDNEQDQGGDNETGEQDEAAEQSEAPAGSTP